MNLVYDLLDEEYKLNYGEIHNLYIENLKEFRSVVVNLCKENNKLNIYNGEELIYPEVLIDFFNYEFNNKKIINKIIKDISIISNSELYFEEKYNLDNLINNFLQKVLLDYDIELKIDKKAKFENILTTVGINIFSEGNDFLTNIINYLLIYINVFNKTEFYMINLNLYLNKEEIKLLEEFVKINNILIICVNKVFIENLFEKNQLLYDNDLCRVF